MAKYTVTCSKCGKEYSVDLFGPVKTREWKLDHWDWTCDECIQAERDKAAAAATTASKDEGLPLLRGSEKQVTWAELIRRDTLKKLEYLKGLYGDTELYVVAIEEVMVHDRAGWWIDHRDYQTDEWHCSVILKIIDGLKKQPEKTDAVVQAAALEAKAEATVRPETPVSEIAVVIQQTERAIRIKADGFVEELRDVMRTLRYSWDKEARVWVKKLSEMTENPDDRVVEAGSRLLAAGIVIRIYDPELRGRAAKGEYTPEHPLWVINNKGRFLFLWPKDTDLYKTIKRLPQARYSSDLRGVLVPGEQYADVQDFADKNGFKLSSGAAKLVEEAEILRRKNLIGTPEIHEPDVPDAPKLKPESLEIPERVEVHEDLRDND